MIAKQTKQLLLVALIVSMFSGCISVPKKRITQRDLQPKKGSSEYSLSYGRFSAVQLLYALGNDGDVFKYDVYKTGNIFGSYGYYVNNRVALGGTIGFEAYKFAWHNEDLHTDYNETTVLPTASLEAKIIVNDRRNLQFYQLYGLGASYIRSKYTDTPQQFGLKPNKGFAPNFQFTPIGIRFGSEIGGFFELGLGYKGWINMGLYYHILPRKQYR